MEKDDKQAKEDKEFLAIMPKLDSGRADTLLEDVIGCRWTISVLRAVAGGIKRPSALERHIEGISAKVLNDRLQHLTLAGILKRSHYAEIPPRVEYELSPLGKKFGLVLRAVERLQKELDGDPRLKTTRSKTCAPKPRKWNGQSSVSHRAPAVLQGGRERRDSR